MSLQRWQLMQVTRDDRDIVQAVTTSRSVGQDLDFITR